MYNKAKKIPNIKVEFRSYTIKNAFQVIVEYEIKNNFMTLNSPKRKTTHSRAK